MTTLISATTMGFALTSLINGYSGFNEQISHQYPKTISQVSNLMDTGTRLSQEYITPDSLQQRIQIMEGFIETISKNTKEISPDYSRLVDENFWDLI